ncbi:MAG: response regulator [Candidatus Eisenbacteria bacterium]|nr:response regulator [Candidatus Eisenbacteria bacterium]
MISGRILVIDDDPLLRRLTARLLAAEGMDAVTAADGNEGLKALQEQEPFDAVICDLLMPDMSGFDVVREIRKDERFRELPILVLTSQGMHEDRDTALEAGADLYMTKPFSSFEFMEALRRLLGPAERKRAS